MFAGMVFLLVVVYSKTGGAGAHQALTELADKVPAALQKGGAPGLDRHAGGRLAHLVAAGLHHRPGRRHRRAGAAAADVRFMTVKSGRELNRALVPGGVFILLMTGVAFVAGALTNVYFWNGQGRSRSPW